MRYSFFIKLLYDEIQFLYQERKNCYFSFLQERIWLPRFTYTELIRICMLWRNMWGILEFFVSHKLTGTFELQFLDPSIHGLLINQIMVVWSFIL